MEQEIGWFAVPKYPTYEINEHTLLVRHKLLKRVKKYYLDECGYLRTNIQYNGKKVKPCQHQLVALTFIPNPGNKPEVNHKDGNKLNNAVSNLEWATQAENKAHAMENWLIAHKLKPDDVLFIRNNFGKMSIKELMSKFGVTRATIRNVLTGRVRNEVGGPILRRMGKPVIDTRDGTLYQSARELAKKISIPAKEIHRRLNGERKNNTPYKYV